MKDKRKLYRLFDRHLRQVKGFPYHIARKYKDYTWMGIKDLCQEGHAKIWETLLEQPTCTTSYLRDRVSSAVFAAYKRGKSLDNHYQNKKRRERPVRVFRISDGKLGQNLIVDKRLSPEDMVEGKLMYEKFMKTLNKEERKIVKLKLLGFKHKEISRSLGGNKDTVRKKLVKIRPRFNTVYGLA